jgi:hypothetical protein
LKIRYRSVQNTNTTAHHKICAHTKENVSWRDNPGQIIDSCLLRKLGTGVSKELAQWHIVEKIKHNKCSSRRECRKIYYYYYYYYYYLENYAWGYPKYLYSSSTWKSWQPEKEFLLE